MALGLGVDFKVPNLNFTRTSMTLHNTWVLPFTYGHQTGDWAPSNILLLNFGAMVFCQFGALDSALRPSTKEMRRKHLRLG